MSAAEAKLVHVKVRVSGVLAAAVQQVWAIVRNYAEAEVWFGVANGGKAFTRLLVSHDLTTS